MNIYTILGIKPEWKIYFDNSYHLEAERLDMEDRLEQWMERLEQPAQQYILWHIEKTTPVFGEWNYTKKMKK